MKADPLCIELTRGESIESIHFVDVAVVDSSGKEMVSFGDTDKPVLPRSAIKPIQALPLLETGAAEKFHLHEIEIALACSSHSGEKLHVEAIENWLSKIGCRPEDLQCGRHDPMNFNLVLDEIHSERTPRVTANNCSGKHTGFLTVMRHLEIDHQNYLDPLHPLHADYVTPTLSEICHVDLSKQQPGIDGCGIPVWAVPINGLARGWAELNHQPSAPSLFEAMKNQAFSVAGTDRICTEIISSTKGKAIVKTGAEGVFCAAIPEEQIGVALKVRDGASRAAAAALKWILGEHGVVDKKVSEPLTNHVGKHIGEIRVSLKQA